MNQLSFEIHISSDQFLEYYRGSAKNVMLNMSDGKSIQFPASILQPFVQHNGVHGKFVLRFDKNNKFVDIKRLS